MSNAIPVAIYIICLALHVGIYLLHRGVPDPDSQKVVSITLLFLSCHGLLLLVAALDAMRARGVWGRLVRHLPRRQTAPQEGAEAAPKTKDAAAKESATWDSLPVLAIPVLGRSAREAVITFAQKHGLKPFEAERGFVLADSAGNYYKVALNP